MERTIHSSLKIFNLIKHINKLSKRKGFFNLSYIFLPLILLLIPTIYFYNNSNSEYIFVYKYIFFFSLSFVTTISLIKIFNKNFLGFSSYKQKKELVKLGLNPFIFLSESYSKEELDYLIDTFKYLNKEEKKIVFSYLSNYFLYSRKTNKTENIAFDIIKNQYHKDFNGDNTIKLLTSYINIIKKDKDLINFDLLFKKVFEFYLSSVKKDVFIRDKEELFKLISNNIKMSEHDYYGDRIKKLTNALK